MSDADESYVTKDLQRQFSKQSPQEVYQNLCEQESLKPSKIVLSLLSPVEEDWYSLVVLDLSKTYIGPKSITPLCRVCKVLSNLRRIDLTNNCITNGAVWSICRMAAHHYSLQEIELRDNRQITWTGAMCLSELAVKNSNIIYIGLRGTSASEKTLEDIFNQTRFNASTKSVLQAGSRRSRSAVSRRINLLKSGFTALEDDNRTADTTKALQMMLEIDGQEGIEEGTTGVRRDTLGSRLRWEVFLLLAVRKSPGYAEEQVEGLRKVFLEFAFNFNQTLLFKVSDTEKAYLRYHDFPMTPEAKSAFFERMDLSEELSINWDEFLFLFYNADVADINLVANTLTPALKQRCILHF
ncbi:hypothetical protein AGDE_08844 [Angomonas deanei]|nr:hypothetical protein AGDE_08844 [Angomonas deanei]|eukprot:EPY32143.1 hypothetical protein AGDE_08844 [Angomonas deanei]